MANSTTLLRNLIAPNLIVSDLNDCDYLGLYIYNTDTANTPSSYGVCFTLATAEPKHTGHGWVAQIVYTAGTDNNLYFRKRINNTSWTEWKKFSPITNLTNANDFTNMGLVNISNNTTNTPWSGTPTENVIVITFPIQTSAAVQLCTCMSASDANFTKIYKRRYYTSWSNWVEISS